jgi:hypothetical protein
MRVPVLICAAALLLVQPATGQDNAPVTAPAEKPTGGSVHFVTDLVPMLNRLGCNATKCHGSAMGKGGLKLSMFGAEPELDYMAVTKWSAGRRINKVEPAKSLMLLKATATINHGGGKKFDVGSSEYNLLARWIAHGTPYRDENAARLVSVKAVPEEQVLQKGGTQQLQVKAIFSDGTEKDVTREAAYASSQEDVAGVDTAGNVTAVGFGQSTIVVSHSRRFAVVRIIVPQPLPSPFPEFTPHNKIDELVVAKLKQLGIPPSGLCSDEVFLRRVYLDTIGTLPTPDEARAFLADSDPQKRSKLIDKVLASDEFADFWALKWGDLMRIKSEYPSNLWPNAVQAYHHWIRDSIAHNKPYDQFATELITSSGSNFRQPAANFYRAYLKRTPQNVAEVTALVFMGTRIGCARCHAHPEESWSLDDNIGLAAFFAQLRYKASREWKEEIVFVNPAQTMRHPRTNEVAKPKFLDAELLQTDGQKDLRREFAQWLTAPENPWFARNIVNRVWFWLLGRGIIHEPDDLRSTNPPTNPKLLKYLEQELTSHKYDLKHIYRLILNSRTYQLSSKTNQWNQNDTAYFSHYYVKRLGAETLLDAIGQVTERWDTYSSRVPEPFVRLPVGFRATHLADGSIDLPFLQMFGRPPRDTAFESARDLELSMRQTLHLLNSSDVQNKINASPRLRRFYTERKTDPEIIEELYLCTVSRYPSDADKQRVADYMSGAGRPLPEPVRAEHKATTDALAAVTAELAKANAGYEAAEKAAKEAEAAAAPDAADKRKLASDAKARRDKLAADQAAANSRLTAANQKVDAARAALKPRRDQAFQDLLWALFNTKEFLFNH